MLSTHRTASQHSTHDASHQKEQSLQANSDGAQGESPLARTNALMSVPMVRTPSYDSLSSQISCSSLTLEDVTPLYLEKTIHEPNFKSAQCFSWTFQQARDSQYSSPSSPSVAPTVNPDAAKNPAPKSTDIAFDSGTQARSDLAHDSEVKKSAKKNKDSGFKANPVSRQTVCTGWSPAEDAMIKKAVSNYKGSAFTQWSELGQKLPNRRIGKQVRDRWVNYLNPALDHKKFTQNDDLKLWRAVKAKGTRWSEISSEYFASAKSENQLKNRWHSARFRHTIKSHLLKEKK